MKPVLRLLRSAATVVAPTLGAGLLRGWGATLRVRRRGMEWAHPAPAFPGPTVVAFWHDQLLLLILALIRRKVPYTALVSRHPDAEPITRMVERLGLNAVRGSSTRGGTEAARALARTLRAGGPIVFTPDGPKGPRRVASPGVVAVARLGHARILAVGAAATPTFTARSWDRLQAPAPFARVAVAEGELITVPAESRHDPALIGKVQSALDDATARAEAMLR